MHVTAVEENHNNNNDDGDDDDEFDMFSSSVSQ
jgi:hypothetical protein